MKTVSRILRSLALFILLAPAMPVHAAAPAASAQSVEQAYKEVDLADLVKTTRSPQRIILNPYPVSFTARLEALPRAQKADYLNKAMAMMQMSQPPKVSRAVMLGHGGDGKLPAYIEDAAAARLEKEARPGETRKFYAFHVYNYSKGPALVIVSFGGRP